MALVEAHGHGKAQSRGTAFQCLGCTDWCHDKTFLLQYFVTPPFIILFKWEGKECIFLTILTKKTKRKTKGGVSAILALLKSLENADSQSVSKTSGSMAHSSDPLARRLFSYLLCVPGTQQDRAGHSRISRGAANSTGLTVAHFTEE